MKRLLPMALAAIVVGCSPSSPSSSSASDSSGSEPAPSPVVEKARSSDDSRVYRREDLKVVTMNLKGKPFRLWVMDNGGKRQEGMMFLRDGDVQEDQGMLFAFPDVQKGGESNGFWMRNCPLALDIIYLSPENRVLNVGNGVPFSEDNVPPVGSYQNVIELKAGTAERIGLRPGTAVELPTGLKPTAD